jgi:hypothetical protein
MPSHFKQVVARGIQKMPVYTHAHMHAHKQRTLHQHYLNWVVPQAMAPAPGSSVFDTNDCIWHYGTVYVREAVAVEKIQGQQQQIRQQQEQHAQVLKEQLQHIHEMHHMHHAQKQSQESHEDDDDTESTSGGSVNAFKCSRNIGKQNQLKHLKDGMRLRHLLLVDHAMHEWTATFDAETNRIIRTSDGVAFDTLRQFARLHSNEALAMDLASTNVWSDPNFQYQDDASGHWHPLADLKK